MDVRVLYRYLNPTKERVIELMNICRFEAQRIGVPVSLRAFRSADLCRYAIRYWKIWMGKWLEAIKVYLVGTNYSHAEKTIGASDPSGEAHVTQCRGLCDLVYCKR